MTPSRRSASRVPVMLSESDVESLIHAIRECSIMERPSSNTIAKLATALRRLNPERDAEAWADLEAIR
jgi:hypothetical protein